MFIFCSYRLTLEPVLTLRVPHHRIGPVNNAQNAMASSWETQSAPNFDGSLDTDFGEGAGHMQFPIIPCRKITNTVGHELIKGSSFGMDPYHLAVQTSLAH